jgi:hypothetical protein
VKRHIALGSYYYNYSIPMAMPSYRTLHSNIPNTASRKKSKSTHRYTGHGNWDLLSDQHYHVEELGYKSCYTISPRPVHSARPQKRVWSMEPFLPGTLSKGSSCSHESLHHLNWPQYAPLRDSLDTFNLMGYGTSSRFASSSHFCFVYDTCCVSGRI